MFKKHLTKKQKKELELLKKEYREFVEADRKTRGN